MPRATWHARDLGDDFVLALPSDPPDPAASRASLSYMERLLGAALRAGRSALREVLLDIHSEIYGPASFTNDTGRLVAARDELVAAAETGRVLVTRNPRRPEVSPLARDEDELEPVSA
jgi:hypothetical protein